MSTTPFDTATVTNPPATTTTGRANGEGDPRGPGPGRGNSTLYLFTFLATLFLLLAVSSAIVLRSFILRRRFRSRLDEAIAAGLILPGTSHRKRDFGEKPKLYEAHIAPVVGFPEWETIMPVSALPEPDPSVDKTRQTSTPVSVSTPLQRTLQTFGYVGRQEEIIPPAPLAPPIPWDEPLDKGQSTRVMNVSVLIAMPSPHHYLEARKLRKWDDEEEEVPHLTLGTMQLPYTVEAKME